VWRERADAKRLLLLLLLANDSAAPPDQRTDKLTDRGRSEARPCPDIVDYRHFAATYPFTVR
jgi:hypothetical protein